MIDTVVLTIPENKVAMIDTNKFSSELGAKGFSKYIQNPSKTDYQTGNYKPRLTLNRRFGNPSLRIEFSIPKLLFGNNLDEVEESDFEEVLKLLLEKLREMGIQIFSAILENSSVSTVHYSKNIPLSDRYTASIAISELRKLDVSKRLEINDKNFRNFGNSLYFDCGTHQIIFYDKLRDIKKNERQSIDQDKTLQQLDLFNSFKNSNIELLRFEVRITNKQKLNSLLSQLGFQANPTFRDIFRKDKSMAFLNHYWNTISSDKTRFILAEEENDEHLLKDIISYYKKNGNGTQVKTAFATFGLIKFGRNQGIRPLRNLVEESFTERSWFREASKVLTQATTIFENRKPFGFVEDIEKTLASFQPYRTSEVLKGKQQ